MTSSRPVTLGWTAAHLGSCEHCRRKAAAAVIVLDGDPADLDATAYLCLPCAAVNLGVSPDEAGAAAWAATAVRAAAVAGADGFVSQFPEAGGGRYVFFADWKADFDARAAELGLDSGEALGAYGRHLETLATEGLSALGALGEPPGLEP